MKNSLEKFRGRSEQPEERISQIENRATEIIKSKEQQQKKIEEKQTEPKGPAGTPSRGSTYTS